MINKLYDYFSGVVWVRLHGNNLRRFINLCTQNDIILKKIVVLNNELYECCIYRKDFKRLKPHLKKTHTKVTIVSKEGFPNIIKKYRKRFIWGLSIICLGIILNVLAGRIWKINIEGNSIISDDEIVSYLSETDSGFGALKADIDTRNLERALRYKFEDISWVSVEKFGTVLNITIKERLSTEKKADFDKTCDIISDVDGVVTSIKTRSGVALVEEGQRIKKGDKLVQSAYLITDDSEVVKDVYWCNTDADIRADVNYVFYKEIPKKFKTNISTGKVQYKFNLQFRDYNLSTVRFGKKYNKEYVIKNVYQIRLVENLYMPVFFAMNSIFEVKEIWQTNSVDDARKKGQEYIDNYINSLKDKDVKINNTNIDIEQTENNYIIKGQVSLNRLIGKDVPAEKNEYLGRE